jgi:uroporphyrinogen III methyltransferase / synthase
LSGRACRVIVPSVNAGLGVVCFVGLGPGDPRLRTERASARLAEADVVVRDSDGVAAERLIALAREGKRVVRAIEGDPLESPSVVEEVREVARAGVPIEVVPGIDARAAAAAFAGVLGPAVRAETAQLAAALVGHSSATVVTIVADAGLPSQRLVTTTAAEALGRASELRTTSVLLAFGTPDDTLRWVERRPLFGKRVLVTRGRDQAVSTAALLRELGAEAVVVPTIEIRPPRDPGPLDSALLDLRAGAYGWVAFTSANGVEHTWRALALSGHDARAFGSARIAAIGPATVRALESHGLRADAVAREFRGEGLAEEMIVAIGPAGSRPRVLVARAARARDALPDALRAVGCRVDVVPAYETHPVDGEALAGLANELSLGRLDAVLFTSSSTVDSLCDALGARAPDLLARSRIASIGPVTTATAAARGLRVDVTAAEYTLPGVLLALAESYR